MWIEGVGLHTGATVRARWVREAGPLKIRRVDGTPTEVEVSLAAARMAPRAARVQLADGRTVDTIEHMMSALAARGCFEGVTLEVDGPECPLGDGGASGFCAALDEFSPCAPRFFVAHEASFAHEDGTLTCAPGPRAIEVTTDFRAHGLGAHTVTWEGDWADYRLRIATARTFGFVSEAEAFRAAGLARSLPPESIVVFGSGGVADPRFATPTSEDEHARHKLLDAIGDIGLLGGAVRGRLRLECPGHARTLALLREAVRAGAIAENY